MKTAKTKGNGYTLGLYIETSKIQLGMRQDPR